MDNLKRTAHGLKGSPLGFLHSPFRELALEIELDADQGGTDNLHNAIKQLEKMSSDIIEKLKSRPHHNKVA